jgi:predicted acylesterase/phospholipase RssA
MSSYYDALLLSGGSVRVLSTLGALQYCYDHQLIEEIQTYCGVSAGAMTAYLLAIGYTPTELITDLCTHKVFDQIPYFDILSMMNGEGAMSFSAFQHHLERLSIRRIGYLPTLQEVHERIGKRLVIATYNYTRQELEWLTPETHPTLPCIVALIMSSCLPLLFKPFEYMNQIYLDGGILDNFPIESICHQLESQLNRPVKLLGVWLQDDMDPHQTIPQSMIEYVYQLMTISHSHQRVRHLSFIEDYKGMTDIIRIPSDISLLQFQLTTHDKLELFSKGYDRATSHFHTSPSIEEVDYVSDAPVSTTETNEESTLLFADSDPESSIHPTDEDTETDTESM